MPNQPATSHLKSIHTHGIGSDEGISARAKLLKLPWEDPASRDTTLANTDCHYFLYKAVLVHGVVLPINMASSVHYHSHGIKRK